MNLEKLRLDLEKLLAKGIRCLAVVLMHSYMLVCIQICSNALCFVYYAFSCSLLYLICFHFLLYGFLTVQNIYILLNHLFPNRIG